MNSIPWRRKVKIEKVNISFNTIENLKRNLVMFYTGKQRLNKNILGEQDKSTKKNEKQVLNSLHYIKESGYKILDIVESGNITELGKMFDEHWQYKKKLAKGITNPIFDSIYELAKKNGALGGKISGAGGGGFMIFICDPTKKGRIIDALRSNGAKIYPSNFTFSGAKSWECTK